MLERYVLVTLACTQTSSNDCQWRCLSRIVPVDRRLQRSTGTIRLEPHQLKPFWPVLLKRWSALITSPSPPKKKLVRNCKFCCQCSDLLLLHGLGLGSIGLWPLWFIQVSWVVDPTMFRQIGHGHCQWRWQIFCSFQNFAFSTLAAPN